MHPVILLVTHKPDERLPQLVAVLVPHGVVVVASVGGGHDHRDGLAAAEAAGAVVLPGDHASRTAALQAGLRHVLDTHPGAGVVVAKSIHNAQDILSVAAALETAPETLALGARTPTQLPPAERAGGALLRVLLRSMVGLELTDTQSTLRGYPAALLGRLLALEGARQDFDLAVLLQLPGWGVPFCEVRVGPVAGMARSDHHRRLWWNAFLVLSRLMKFFASSLLCTGLDFLLYSLLLPHVPTMAAYLLSRVVTATLNYQLNRRVVFRAKGSARSALGYGLLALGVMAVGSIAVSGLTRLGLHGIASKVVVDGILFFLNFYLQKTVLFHKK